MFFRANYACKLKYHTYTHSKMERKEEKKKRKKKKVEKTGWLKEEKKRGGGWCGEGKVKLKEKNIMYHITRQ